MVNALVSRLLKDAACRRKLEVSSSKVDVFRQFHLLLTSDF
jgi:hypothetical protein